MTVLVYTNGGNNYHGQLTNNNLNHWKEYGKKENQKYMYKGYHYYNNKKYIVIVYDNNKWNNEEKNRRKNNSFLGIKEYIINGNSN